MVYTFRKLKSKLSRAKMKTVTSSSKMTIFLGSTNRTSDLSLPQEVRHPRRAHAAGKGERHNRASRNPPVQLRHHQGMKYEQKSLVCIV